MGRRSHGIGRCIAGGTRGSASSAARRRRGISADYVERPMERIDTAFEFADWIPTAAGKALLRSNQPVLAYIGGGGASGFTAKDHDYRAGQVVEKQLIVINNSRATLTF